jgi:UDP-N-acetylmuramoylalanine--D-glutamate ligase
MKIDYRGQRVTIMGLGHFGGGVAATRWLAGQGAVVTVTDLAGEDTLADSLAMLDGVRIARMRLGRHREEDFSGADLIVVNPAVRPDSPWLAVTRRSGARLATEVELFMENCPARIVGVTGSNGKSTTAAMIAAILGGQGGQSEFRGEDAMRSVEDIGLPRGACEPGRAAGRHVFLGGNIGRSLLEESPQIGPEDWVVLELSSFQLWHFSAAARMPQIAVVTGCTPNHLDWHGNFAHYAAAKQRILTGQGGEDVAVLNGMDAEVAGWRNLARGRAIVVECVPAKLCGRHVEHNRVNAALAAAAATAAGCGDEEIRRGLESFRSLPQRLEWVAVIEGRRFYNDSAATTPESTIAALRSLDVPVWLLAGGKGKGADLGPLALEIGRRVRGAAIFGSVREELRSLVAGSNAELPCAAVDTMDEALGWCWRRSRPGEAIVLSPGVASTDQFRNYRERGERFAELVQRLTSPLNR